MAKKYHLEIPKENISRNGIKKNPFGTSVPRANHSEHGVHLRVVKDNFKYFEFSKKDINVISEIFLQLSTAKKFSIKSQTTKLENLGFKLVSLVPENESVGNFKIEDRKFEEFESKLEEYISSEDNTYKTYFAAIENINPIPKEDKLPKEINIESTEKYNVVINFYSGLKTEDIVDLEKVLNIDFKELQLDYSFSNISNKLITVKSRLNGKEIGRVLNDFNSIKNIQLNQEYFITNSVKGNAINAGINITSPSSSSAICIFDSGITTTGNILPNLVRSRINNYLPSQSVSPQYSHGTFVASRCIFGDDIEYQISQNSLTPYCYVIDVPVFGLDVKGQICGLNDFDLGDAITEVVESLYTEVKVYNLSLGNPMSVVDNNHSHLATTLDVLSKEYDVLFVVSSGNISINLGTYPGDHFNHPNARIGSPAESLLALTVGSIAKYEYTTSLSRENHISPFSKIGPGADGGLKPELVTHGGNLLAPYNLNPFSRIASCGLYDDGVSVSYDNGTSFSSPIVSRYAQILFDYYPFANTNLIKALLIHFSEKRNVFENFEFDYKYTGFGEPIIEKAIYANDSATYLYQGNLDVDNYEYIKFNIPEQFANADIDSILKLKITIVYNPEVDVNSNYEYSKSRLSAKLVKNSEKGHVEVNLSGSNNYYKQWSPILQFEKSFIRNFIAGEWFVQLRLYTRGSLDVNYTQDYSIIIEVIDGNGAINVYDIIKSDTSLKYGPHDDIDDNINYA